jgi:hypothetical protein
MIEIPIVVHGDLGRGFPEDRQPRDLAATLWIAVVEPTLDGQDHRELDFGLYLFHRLPYAFLNSLAHPLHAVVLTLEQPDAEAAGALRLMGPGQAPPQVPNFVGAPFRDDPTGTYLGHRHGLRVRAHVGGPCDVYVRAALHGLSSNLVAISLPSLALRDVPPEPAPPGEIQ